MHIFMCISVAAEDGDGIRKVLGESSAGDVVSRHIFSPIVLSVFFFFLFTYSFLRHITVSFPHRVVFNI